MKFVSSQSSRRSFTRSPVSHTWNREIFDQFKWVTARWLDARIAHLPKVRSKLPRSRLSQTDTVESLQKEGLEVCHHLQTRVDEALGIKTPPPTIRFSFRQEEDQWTDEIFVREFEHFVDCVFTGRGQVLNRFREDFPSFGFQTDGARRFIELPFAYAMKPALLRWVTVHERLHQLFALSLSQRGISPQAFGLLDEGCVCIATSFLSRELADPILRLASLQDELGALGTCLEYLRRNLEPETGDQHPYQPVRPRVRERYYPAFAFGDWAVHHRGSKALPPNAPKAMRSWALLRLFQDEHQVMDAEIAIRVFRDHEFPNLRGLFPLRSLPERLHSQRRFSPTF